MAERSGRGRLDIDLIDWDKLSEAAIQTLLDKRESFGDFVYCPRNVEQLMERYEEVLSTVLSTVGGSGTGVPYNQFFSSNTQFAEVAPNYLKNEVESILLRLNALTEIEASTLSPEDLVAKGVSSFIRVFGKDEGLPTRKDTCRLIFPASLPDQIVKRLLLGQHFSATTANWSTSPFAVGFGVSGAMNPLVIGKFNVMERPTSVDCSGWDMTVSFVQILVSAITYKLLLGGWLGDMAFKSIITSRNGVITLPDGSLWILEEDGWMCSGSYYTGQLNTHMAVFTARYATVPTAQVFAMGDDTVVDLPEGHDLQTMKAGYSAFKQNLRSLDYKAGSVEFCSHSYELQSGVVEFLGFQKSLVKFLSKTEKERDYDQFVLDMKLAPEIGAFVSCVLASKPGRIDEAIIGFVCPEVEPGKN